jgi:hypothetical protein
MMTEPPPSPLDPTDDDIQDPVVPETTVQALTGATIPSTPALPGHNDPMLQGFLQAVYAHLKHQFDDYYSDLKARILAIDTEHLRLCATLEQVTRIAKDGIEKASQHNEHAQYQWSDALLKLQEHGLALRHDPYTVRVRAVAPQGYPVDITIAKGNVQELTTALPALVGWLGQEGYKPVID